ncbi:MAG: hypothetical protein R3310_15495 [Candidatus Competibacteraceae bacterium]|nr:hypothetical protein [Candidatus Competibacteraceae bacterium]
MNASTQTRIHDYRPALTPAVLHQQNRTFAGSGGVSHHNRSQGFAPAFLDRETGRSYRACFADGRPAPMHLLDGLPGELVTDRLPCGRVLGIKETVEAGFLRRERFFTRTQAARALRLAERIHAWRTSQ